MSNPDLRSSKVYCSPCLAILLVGVILLLVAVDWVAKVIRKVFGGAGMEYCCTIEGVPFNYLAVFLLICGMAIVLFLAAALQFHDWRVRREIYRKYGVKVPASNRSQDRFSSSESGSSLHGVDCGDSD